MKRTDSKVVNEARVQVAPTLPRTLKNRLWKTVLRWPWRTGFHARWMSRNGLAFLLALASLTPSAKADVRINYQYLQPLKRDRTTVPSGSVGILVVSTFDMSLPAADTKEFLNLELKIGETFGGDNVIADVFLVQDFGGIFGFAGVHQIKLDDVITENDPMAAYWFPDIFVPERVDPTGRDTNKEFSGPTVMAGDSFGFFTTDEVIDGSTENDGRWRVPGDGKTINLNALSMDLGGSVPSSVFEARFVVIPEANAAILVALGLGVFLMGRRRNAHRRSAVRENQL